MGFARSRTEYQSADRNASEPNSTSNSANILMPILYHKLPANPTQQAINNAKEPFFNGFAGPVPNEF